MISKQYIIIAVVVSGITFSLIKYANVSIVPSGTVPANSGNRLVFVNVSAVPGFDKDMHSAFSVLLHSGDGEKQTDTIHFGCNVRDLKKNWMPGRKKFLIG